jgi:hypothetical protein
MRLSHSSQCRLCFLLDGKQSVRSILCLSKNEAQVNTVERVSSLRSCCSILG